MSDITSNGIRYKDAAGDFKKLVLKSSMVDTVLAGEISGLRTEVENLEDLLQGIKTYLGVS